jgi:hypothetical protein
MTFEIRHISHSYTLIFDKNESITGRLRDFSKDLQARVSSLPDPRLKDHTSKPCSKPLVKNEGILGHKAMRSCR